MKPVRVLVANHPRLMRELVMATIADQPDIELVGKGRNESDLADIVEQVQPDVLIIAMNETEKRLGQCGFLLGRHPEMRPAKRGKHLPPILSTAKQTPAPKPAPSGFYRTLLAITTDLSVQRGQALSRSKQVAVLAEEE